MNQYNPANNVEELANRLDQMNVEPVEAAAAAARLYYGDRNRRLESQDSSDSGGYLYDNNESRMSLDEEPNYNNNNNNSQQQQQQQRRQHDININNNRLRHQQRRNDDNDGNILIVTNLDPAVFSDKLMKAKFESLFTSYDERVTIRYLKSFRRVRLDFTSCHKAELARNNLNNYKLGATAFKCFLAQIIRPNFDNPSRDDQDERVQRVHGPETDDEDDYYNEQHQHERQRFVKKGYLNIPKLTRQYLISPPMSPPENWRPKEESEPCIDVQLLAAIANLVPGQTHELHAGNESQPGIVVEVCEEPYFDTTSKLSCKNKLPKTTIPGTPRPEPVSLITNSAAGDEDEPMQS